MRLSEITLGHKERLEKALSQREHQLCAYSFSNIYIWKKLYKIFNISIDGSCCIFFKDGLGCFAYLPPLGKESGSRVIEKVFSIMDGFNVQRAMSRIENVEEEGLGFFRELGYACEEKPGDYLCKRGILAGLKGDRFKSKRAACNFFASNYKFTYRSFTADDKEGALQLYQLWVQQRSLRSSDKVYLGMMQDSLLCQIEAMNDLKSLGLLGRVIEVEGRICAYTIGYPLNNETFCILFETTDLTIKGAAQYIFRRFCEDLEYKYINIMDDSGLENLKKVKLSYHPFKIVPSYIIKRRDV